MKLGSAMSATVALSSFIDLCILDLCRSSIFKQVMRHGANTEGRRIYYGGSRLDV